MDNMILGLNKEVTRLKKQIVDINNKLISFRHTINQMQILDCDKSFLHKKLTEICDSIESELHSKESIKKKVILNKYDTNSNIEFNLLPKEEMQKLGFEYNDENHNWEYTEELSLGAGFYVFYIAFFEKEGEVLIGVFSRISHKKIDWQTRLEKNPNDEIPLKIKSEVEQIMFYLKENNILYGHEYGEWI